MMRIWVITGLLILALPGLAGESTGKAAKPRLYLDPRITAALDEMSALADAEEWCVSETNYYTALEALNDQSVPNLNRPWDYINYGGGCYVIQPALGRFRTGIIDYLTGPLAWGGPYMTFQSGKFQTGTTPYDQGAPLDPWGSPYYFFTPLGLVRGDTGTISQELYGDAFDRYTIVSLGPDGIMSNDDLAFQFGSGVTMMALSSLRVVPPLAGKPLASAPAAKVRTAPEGTFYAQAGYDAIVRGINLGTGLGVGKVLFNGAEIDTVTSWTTREVRLNLPESLGGQSGTLTVQHGATISNGLPVFIIGRANAVKGWQQY